MRALIVAFGSHGDVLPLAAIGAELKRRGHDVTLASAEPFAGVAQRAGLDFESLATEADYQAALGHPDLWRPIKGLKRLFGFAETSIRPVFDFIARRRDPQAGTIVVASTLAIGARLAQDALKIPLVTVHLSPLLIQSRYAPSKLPGVPDIPLPPRLEWEFQLGVDEWIVDPLLTPKLNEIRTSIGLPPIKRLRHWWNAPRRVLLMCPDWFARPQQDWPQQTRQVGFPKVDDLGGEGELDPKIAAFLAGGEPPVLVTFGTAMKSGAALYGAAIAACLKAGRRCLVLAPVCVDVPAGAGDRVLVAGYAPFAKVLPACAAVIHHGGIGTLARALEAGTPQLIVPLAFDQFDNAKRVRALGCGIAVGRLAFRAGHGVVALKRLIASPMVAAACAAVAARPFDGAVSHACDEIEAEFAARRGKGKGAVAAKKRGG